MAELTGRQIKDSTVQRRDIDTTTAGQSVITKLIVAGAGAPTMTDTGVDEGTGDVTLTFSASGGAASPPWHGTLYALWGTCDPTEYTSLMTVAGSVAGPTPTGIGTTIARCVKFRPPANMTATKLYLFGVAATTNLYKFAIYRASDNTRVWESGVVSSPANAWQTITLASLVLLANTDYWFCVTAAAVGTTAGYRSPSAPFAPALFGAGAAPLGNTSYGIPAYAQFAVTGGVFPATLPALAAAVYAGGATGSVPFAFVAP